MADENVNIQDEADYYYDMTPTAEEIDNILVDLVAVLKDVGEFDVVKRVKAINGERAKFVLGEGGSGKTVIPGDLDILIATDGQGNAKTNSGIFYSKITNGTAQLLTPINALELGTIVASSPSYTYWGSERQKMLMHLEGNPLFQMISMTGAPIFSMQGSSIIEINGDSYMTPSNYKRSDSDYLSFITQQVYKDYTSPFNKDKTLMSETVNFPYVHLNDNSTLIMEGASMIKTAGGAGMELSGNATFRVHGAGQDERYPIDQAGQTYVTFHPGSFFRMSSGCEYDTIKRKWIPVDNSGHNHGPLFNMESSSDGGQIMLTNQWIQNQGNGDIGSDWGFWNLVNYKHDRILSLDSNTMYEGLRPRVSVSRTGSLGQYTYNVYQSTLGVQGKTNIIIGGAGAGVLAARIATTKYAVLDWTGQGEMDIKIGEGANSAITVDIGDNGGATGYYKICPDEKSNTVFLFEPSSKTSINFAPNGFNGLKPSNDESMGYCGIDFTPYKTELDCRWYKLNADFQGNDAFIQTTGNFHVENHAGTFILRGSQEVATGANFRESDRTKTHLHKLWQSIYASDISAPVLQLYDKANFAMYGDMTAAPLEMTKTYYLAKKDFPTEPTKQDFETTMQYQSFINSIPDTYIWSGNYNYSCDSHSSTQWKISISYNYTYTEYITEIPAPTDSPVFEMRSVSELRVRDGAYIKAQTTKGETTITFGSNRSQEESVSFTLAELKALKNLIANT